MSDRGRAEGVPPLQTAFIERPMKCLVRSRSCRYRVGPPDGLRRGKTTIVRVASPRGSENYRTAIIGTVEPRFRANLLAPCNLRSRSARRRDFARAGPAVAPHKGHFRSRVCHASPGGAAWHSTLRSEKIIVKIGTNMQPILRDLQDRPETTVPAGSRAPGRNAPNRRSRCIATRCRAKF